MPCFWVHEEDFGTGCTDAQGVVNAKGWLVRFLTSFLLQAHPDWHIQCAREWADWSRHLGICQWQLHHTEKLCPDFKRQTRQGEILSIPWHGQSLFFCGIARLAYVGWTCACCVPNVMWAKLKSNCRVPLQQLNPHVFAPVPVHQFKTCAVLFLSVLVPPNVKEDNALG